MEAYFEELLQRSVSSHNATANATNSDHEDDTSDYDIQNEIEQNPISQPPDEPVITPNDSTPDDQIKGGKNKATIGIIYSFITPILQLIHVLSPNVKIYDVSQDMKKIIKSVHANLENKFMSSEEIANRIISKLVDTIVEKAATHDYIFVSVNSKCAPFDLTSFFSKLVARDKQRRYILKFINPDFDALLDQVIANYNSTHHRLTLNEDILHIIKHYSQTQQSTSHAITFDQSSINESFTRISSAFTDSNDKSSFVDLFIHRLNPESPATYSIVHIFAASAKPNVEVIDTPKSSLTSENFKPILRQILEQ